MRDILSFVLCFLFKSKGADTSYRSVGPKCVFFTEFYWAAAMLLPFLSLLFLRSAVEYFSKFADELVGFALGEGQWRE